MRGVEWGGGGVGTRKFGCQKWPHQIFLVVNFVVSRNDYVGLGGGGAPPPLLLRCTAIPLLPFGCSVFFGGCVLFATAMVATLAPNPPCPMVQPPESVSPPLCNRTRVAKECGRRTQGGQR